MWRSPNFSSNRGGLPSFLARFFREIPPMVLPRFASPFARKNQPWPQPQIAWRACLITWRISARTHDRSPRTRMGIASDHRTSGLILHLIGQIESGWSVAFIISIILNLQVSLSLHSSREGCLNTRLGDGSSRYLPG